MDQHALGVQAVRDLTAAATSQPGAFERLRFDRLGGIARESGFLSSALI